MDDRKKYKEGIKAYKVGFGSGVIGGIAICIVTGKFWFTLPVLLGLFFGAIAFQLKTKDNETTR